LFGGVEIQCLLCEYPRNRLWHAYSCLNAHRTLDSWRE
jgi:hypothetical protein